MSTENDPLAAEAIRDVQNGMVVGLGTGRAASRGIQALATRVKEEQIDIRCVATSLRSAELAESLGLRVLPMRDVPAVDLLFDGVDELDPNLAMTKGGGGAMTREKIVAESAAHRIYLMQDTKLVDHLGEKFPLPVEVLEFGLASTQRRLEIIGLVSHVRKSKNDCAEPDRTDEDNLILDCDYGDMSKVDLAELDYAINAVPGVVGHGLFVDQADVVLIEYTDGKTPLEHRQRLT